MQKLSLSNVLRSASALCVFASATSGYAQRAVEFQNDIVPILTRFGCNAGACHGAAVGRGGLKLSLYGSNPSADYDAVVRQLRGRRINTATPDESLLLLKPTEQIAHGGGNRFELESDAFKTIRRWIADGASSRQSREFIGIKVTPESHFAKSIGEQLKVRVVASFSDGSTQDVTTMTVLTAEDDSAIEVDNESAVLTTKRRGRQLVIARFLTEVQPIEVVVPLSDGKVRQTRLHSANFIDEEILNKLKRLRLPTSPTIDDATFLRRATLDLTGRIPTPQALAIFLENKQSEKRKVLIQSLLASEQFVEYWTFQFAKMLRLRTQQHDEQGASIYNQWIARQLREDVGFDKIARSLLLAEGDAHTSGPANFWRTTRNARDQAEFVSEVFMGSRLRCANCHNHPLDHWTQDDYHGLAAIFAKVEQEVVVRPKPSGRVIHPGTLDPAEPRVPGSRFIDPAALDARQEFAGWLVHPDNPYFAKAIVNRVWKQLMGKGLVEPVDDFRSTNPATHPKLLDQLAADFVDSGFSIQHTITRITDSAAYARSADAIAGNRHDNSYYSHAIKMPLEAEVLADAISDVLGVHEQFGENPIGTRAIALLDPALPSRTLQVLGRCDRSVSCESGEGGIDGLSQKLHQFNGQMLNGRISTADSRLTQLVNKGMTAMEIIESFYHAGLSRPMTKEEATFWKTQTSDIMTSSDLKRFLEDFVWSMISSREFGTKH